MSIQRIKINGARHYVDTKTLDVGISVTEFLGRVFPVSPHLKDWWIDNPREFIEKTLRKTGQFGDDYHDYAERFASAEVLSLDKIQNSKMKHYLTSLQYLFHDRNIKPINVEHFVFHRATDRFPLSFGGTLDLECMIDWYGTSRKALLDYKTGNIFDKHKFQLIAYMVAKCQEGDGSYSEFDYELFNFSPTNWTKKPTGKPKHWKVTKKDLQTFRSLCILYSNEIQNLPSTIRQFSDVAIGQEPAYEQVPLTQYIEQQIEDNNDHLQ